MQVAFYLAGEITQVKESIPGVRCASGNVSYFCPLTFLTFCVLHLCQMMSGGMNICGEMAPRYRIMTDNAGGINDYGYWRENIELWFKWVRIAAESLKGRHHAHNQAVSLIKPAVMMITEYGLKNTPSMMMMRIVWGWRWKNRESSFRTKIFFASLVILCCKSNKGQDT